MEKQELYLLLNHSIVALRRRLLILGLVLACTCTLGYYEADAIMSYMFKMVRQVIFISPTEAFVTKIKVALATGVVLASPILLYGLFGLLRARTGIFTFKTQLAAALISLGLFLAGAGFCFYAVLPVGIDFLLGFATIEMQPMLSAGRFVSFVLTCTLMFGLVFELPLFMALAARIGIINAQTLRRKRKYAILGIFIAAGALTPTPDVISQILMAVPLLALYEIGIFVASFWKKEEAKLEMPPDQQEIYN